MENCKANNIAEKLFRSLWKQGKLPLCKKHFYQGLSINSCSVDVRAIKNALLKHQQIYSKILTVGAVQVFSLELHPQFHFVGFFLLGQKNTEELSRVCYFQQKYLFSINQVVMKYLNLSSSGSMLESVTCKFTRIRTLSKLFFKEFHYKCRTAILKNAS